MAKVKAWRQWTDAEDTALARVELQTHTCANHPPTKLPVPERLQALADQFGRLLPQVFDRWSMLRRTGKLLPPRPLPMPRQSWGGFRAERLPPMPDIG